MALVTSVFINTPPLFSPPPVTKRSYHHVPAVKCLKVEEYLRRSLADRIASNLEPAIKPIEPAIKPIEPPSVKPDQSPLPDVKRKDFPPEFLFGGSTSALQTEGTEGRGACTWDAFILKGELQSAVDSLHKYKEDVQLLKHMGATGYRFSIAWPRILKEGTISGGINEEGVEYYNNLINELLVNGITPIVTLFHFDLPQPLADDYGGFASRKIVEDFKNYADVCFSRFGDRVKLWTTFNEPNIWSHSYTSCPYTAGHHLILAHATAAKHYKKYYQVVQGGEIGISPALLWYEPYSGYHDLNDVDAANRAKDFMIGWFTHPFVYGDYPFSMRSLIGETPPAEDNGLMHPSYGAAQSSTTINTETLLKFSDEEKELIIGSCDFIGINYYTSRYAKGVPFGTTPPPVGPGDLPTTYQSLELSGENANGKFLGSLTKGSEADFPNRPPTYIYPEGLTKVLLYLKDRYKNPKIYITESGVDEKKDDSIPVGKALEDDFRIEHMVKHLHAVKEAMEKGVNVNGFFFWTLMDNVELGVGYDLRMGLNYTDYTRDFKRFPKKSANWLRHFMNCC